MRFLRMASAFVPAVFLCACGSGISTPSDFQASITAAAMTAARILSPQAPSVTPTPAATDTEQALPSLSPTNPSIPSATVRAAPVQSLCDDSAYVSDVTIPDGTVMDPGEEFIKTWSIQNTGTCSWTSAYGLAFVNGTRMDGVITYVPQAVEPGGVVEISVGLVAPSTAGTYTGNWRLQNADGVFFGELVYVQIVVSGGAATAAPTAEITNTLEATAS